MDSVTTDMDTHTVTVQFDDDELSLEEIIRALGDAGYSVPSHATIP
jgi:copper chaperone CopZ